MTYHQRHFAHALCNHAVAVERARTTKEAFWRTSVVNWAGICRDWLWFNRTLPPVAPRKCYGKVAVAGMDLPSRLDDYPTEAEVDEMARLDATRTRNPGSPWEI